MSRGGHSHIRFALRRCVLLASPRSGRRFVAEVNNHVPTSPSIERTRY